MHRQEMKPDHGMLFVYESSQHVSMWMKNTYIALDMVFINSDWVVERIHQNAKPHSRISIHSGASVRYVLELNAGTSERIGLKPGSKLVLREKGG